MTRVHKLECLVVVLLAMPALFADSGWAFTADREPAIFWKRIEEKGVYERIWERLRLYENEHNPFLQAVSVIGRYHGQYAAVDASQGHADEWENRRMFVGAEAVLFHHLTLHAQMRVSEDLDPFYDGLYQAFVEWSQDKTLSVSIGRQDLMFTGLERSTPSTRIATFERGLLADQVMPLEVVGTFAHGESGKFSYRAGLFSGSIEDEFTDFRGGFGAAAGLGYALPLFYKTGRLHLDYLFNNGDPSNNALKPYDNAVSLWHQGQAGALEVGVDLTWANGLEARPDVFGVTVLPTYQFATNVIRKGDAFQAVVRYQFAASDGDNGLQLQSRYEQEVVPGGLGDRYHAAYAGINYLIFGHRLKLMAGAEYSTMHDSANDDGEFDGWTYLAGVRVFF